MDNQQVNTKSRLRFLDYVVDHIDFTTNPDFDDKSVDIKFDVRHEVAEELPDAFVTLHLEIFPNAKVNNYPFSFSISATGHFQIDTENPDEVKAFLNVNAVAILFPYVRALVTTYTANANVRPLILPPINIVNILDKSKIEGMANTE